MQLRRSVAITFFSTNANTIIQFGVTVVLSRLLTPAEVGIFSITIVVTGIAAIFRDFGVSSYIQREKELTPEKIRAALGLLLTSSWVLAALIYLTSGYVADFYAQTGIQAVLKVLSISFLLVPFASFFYALLARNLEAEKQAIVNAVGTVSFATSCILLAWLDFGYMAMAWANVINIASTIIAYIPLRPRGTPCVPAFRNWGPQLRFGAGAILGGLIDRIYNSIPDLVLGKVSGPHDVGLYSRANGLVSIFQQVAGPTINYNAVPYIAKHHHSEQPLAPIISKATSYLTGLSWPAFIITALFAEEIIRVLYGSQWIAAAPIAVYLCIQAAFRMGYSLSGPAMTAIGKPYLSALLAGFAILARIALLLWLDAKDLVTFAAALCLADLISLAAPAVVMSQQLKYSLRNAIDAHMPSLKLGICCLVVALILKAAMPTTWPDITKLLLVGTSVVTIWLFGVVKLNHPLSEELPALARRLLPARFSDYLLRRYFTSETRQS